MNRRLSLVIVMSAALLTAAPATAGAQAGGASFPTVFLTVGSPRGGFNVRFEIRRLRVREPGLAVFGRLNGRVRDRAYPSVQRVRNRTFSFPVTLARVNGAATCARVAVVLARRTAPVLGLPATFAPRTLILRPRRGTGPSTGELLRGAGAAVAANAPPAVTVHLLHALRLQYA